MGLSDGDDDKQDKGWKKHQQISKLFEEDDDDGDDIHANCELN